MIIEHDEANRHSSMNNGRTEISPEVLPIDGRSLNNDRTTINPLVSMTIYVNVRDVRIGEPLRKTARMLALEAEHGKDIHELLLQPISRRAKARELGVDQGTIRRMEDYLGIKPLTHSEATSLGWTLARRQKASELVTAKLQDPETGQTFLRASHSTEANKKRADSVKATWAADTERQAQVLQEWKEARRSIIEAKFGCDAIAVIADLHLAKGLSATRISEFYGISRRMLVKFMQEKISLLRKVLRVVLWNQGH